ncbi:unnamed protein product [Gongylonema pulchrum]|nr:unnamed protein product [Gongylonema pulchrum]
MAGPRSEAVCTMIEECGGLDKIEHLQNHESEEIYKLAYEIIDSYFSVETDDDGIAGSEHFFESTQQNVPSEGFSFQ